MDALWPWLTVAGLGAWHGLSPANGWMFAAACGVRARDGAQVRHVLVPIAIGHAASVAITVWVLAQGILMDRTRLQVLAGALLIGVASYQWLRRPRERESSGHLACLRLRARFGHAGIAFWSGLMATVHGAGLMLVPALVPLCMSNAPAREITASGSVVLALMAVGLHLATMLVTTGAIASGVCRGVALHPRLRDGTGLRHAWPGAQAVTGVLLITIR